MQGKPLRVKPLFIWKVAGVWLLLLATMEWMKQSSSDTRAMWGRRLLTQEPLSPCRATG